MNKIIVFTIFIFTIVISGTAQNSYPKITINDKEFYEYTIVAGDGLYSISKRFGVTQTELHESNEGLTTNIKIGQKILIPIKDEIKKHKISENATIHIVESKQTLYSISKMYGVSIDSLISRNPGAENGIKTGQKLLIANKKIEILNKEQKNDINVSSIGIKHLVKKKETLYSISKKYNIAIHDLISVNPGLENGLKAGTTIIISNQPHFSSNNDKLDISNGDHNNKNDNEAKKDEKKRKYKYKRKTKNEENESINKIIKIDSIVSNAINGNDFIIETPTIVNKSDTSNLIDKLTTDVNAINIVYLLPLVAENEDEVKSNQRFIEFYKGSLLALKNAKANGLSANIYTFSTGKNIDKINYILDSISNLDIDVIIGPAYSNQIDTVISYAKNKNIVSLIPFSSKISERYYYPKLVQFNPPQDSLFSTILENTFASRKREYVIGRFESTKNKGKIFADELCRLLSINNIEYKEMLITPEHIDSIVSTFSNDSTLLMLASTSIADVAPILDSLQNYNLPNVELWGFEEWGINLIKKYPKTIFYSLFNPRPTEAYINEYQNWFGPYRHVIGIKYDLIGYDLTQLTMNNIIYEANKIDFNISSNNEFMQSFPSFEFIKNRWLNTNYYLFCWNNSVIKAINK